MVAKSLPKKLPVPKELIKSHVEKEFKDVCGYCGKQFQKDEVQVVRTLHGREWRFCSEHCLREFHDAVDFKDEELDDDEKGGVVVKHDPAYDD